LQLSQRFRPLISRVCALLPELEGDPIAVEFKPSLTAHRGQLYANHARGQPVHAGTDIRRRLIILDRDLRCNPTELTRILIHELFHFAWVRLGNARRNEYAEMVAGEFKRGARGELGWSSESRKIVLVRASHGNAVSNHPRWREYICESFCDTAAWRYAGVPEHDEFTLSKRYRKARERWFAESFGNRRISI
jgi:hypothetical protein